MALNNYQINNQLKKQLTKNFLIKEYIFKRTSPFKLAKQFRCNHKTIYRFLNRYNICIRSSGESLRGVLKKTRNAKIFTKNFLRNEYCVKKQTINAIARKYNVVHSVVCARIIKYNLPKHTYRGCSSGIHHGNYVDGRGRHFPYPQEFSRDLKTKIRQRDNFTCQHCGMTEKEHLRLFKQQLHIHHINYNIYHCKNNNLITLCLKCNVQANSDRDYWYAYYSKKMEGILK